MRSILAVLGLGICCAALAQTPPAPPPGPALTLTLQQAYERARQYGQVYLEAHFAALQAHEDTVQARAALLPTVNGLSQFIYTQPNGTLSGVFVSNDGPHVYNDYATVHGDLYSPSKRADYHRTLAAEAVARAKADLAARGLLATVTQDFYGLAAAQRKLANARQSFHEAEQFLDISRKQEQGGEAAHADTLKAEIQVEQRRADEQNAQLAAEQARFQFAVLLFPDFNQNFTVTDDLETPAPLPDFERAQSLAGQSNPEIRAAQATVEQQTQAIAAARASYLPSLSFDYFFGINANQFALYNREHLNNLGSAAQAQLNIPIWTWGAARSKVRQAELQLQQAKSGLSFTQRQLLANLHSFYREAETALAQTATLRHTMELSAESLRLTLLRYQAGESTALEVVDAQTTLVQSRNAYDDGLVHYRLALANLQTITGTF